MKRSNKALNLSLGCAVLTSVLAGTSPSVASAKVGSTVNQFGWSVPKNTINFSFYAGQGDPSLTAKNTALMGKWLLQNFNVKITRIDDATDTDQRLNLMLASNNYPDVLTGLTQEQAQKWINQGKAVDVSQYIPKYGQDIKKALGTLYPRYLDASGKLYELPTQIGYLEIPDYAIHIRYDWWRQAGAPVFKTPDQYFNVLKKIQEMHPTNAQGQKVYALSAYDWMNDTMPALAGIWGLKNGWKEDSNHNLTFWPNTQEGLELTLYMNKFYRAGMLDPNSFTNTFDTWKAEVSGQRIVGHIGGWWTTWNAGHEVWQKTLKNWNENMRFTQYSIAAPGVKVPTLSAKNPTAPSGFTIITDHAKDPADVVKWIDFTSTNLGNRIIGWGPPNVPGSLWTYSHGNVKWTPYVVNSFTTNTFDFSKADHVGSGWFDLMDNLSPMNDKGKEYMSYWVDQNFNNSNKWKKMLNDNLKGTEYDDSLQEVSIPPNSPLAIKQTQVNDLLLTGWENAIRSNTPQEAQAKFLQLRGKLNAAGLRDIEKYTTEVYHDRLKGNWIQPNN